MKRFITFLAIIACAAILVLSACGNFSKDEEAGGQIQSEKEEPTTGGDHSSVTDNDSDDKDINGEDNAVSGEDNESQEGSSNPGNSDGQKNTENAAPAESENAQIANMDDAIAFLKKELDERDEINIADTEFIPNDDSPKTDDKGTYYVVSLDSISMKESGGSGTIGKYKVYENGEYELAY